MGVIHHILTELTAHPYIPMLGAIAGAAFGSLRHRSIASSRRTQDITPEEVYEAVLRGNSPVILDLRHPLDMLSDPRVVPGAIRLLPQELSTSHRELPRDREVVFYCTCPSRASSARLAVSLNRLGGTRIRTLRGGLEAWKQLGYPLEDAVDRIGWYAESRAGSNARIPSGLTTVGSST